MLQGRSGKTAAPVVSPKLSVRENFLQDLTTHTNTQTLTNKTIQAEAEISALEKQLEQHLKYNAQSYTTPDDDVAQAMQAILQAKNAQLRSSK